MEKTLLLTVLSILCFSHPLSSSAVSNRVSVDEIQPGDLLLFWISEKGRHVGVYLEDGVFFHSSTTEGVTLSNLNDDYWRYRLISIRRVRHTMSIDELRGAFKKYDHAPYRYGSAGPDRFDCSGLVWRVFGEHGVEVPRTTTGLLRTGGLVMKGRTYLLKQRG